MYGVILLLLHLSRDKEVHLIRSRSGCTKTVFLSGINVPCIISVINLKQYV